MKQRMMKWMCAAPLLLLAGCMVGPDYTDSPTNLNPGWNQHDPCLLSGDKAEVNTSWWRQFHDPELKRLIEASYHENLTLRTAALRILESRVILGIAKGNMFAQRHSCCAPATVARVGPPT